MYREMRVNGLNYGHPYCCVHIIVLTLFTKQSKFDILIIIIFNNNNNI